MNPRTRRLSLDLYLWKITGWPWFQEIVTSTISKTTSHPGLSEETATNFVQWETSDASPKLYYLKSVGNTILSAFAIIFLWRWKNNEFRSPINRNSFQNVWWWYHRPWAAFTLRDHKDHMNHMIWYCPCGMVNILWIDGGTRCRWKLAVFINQATVIVHFFPSVFFLASSCRL